MLVLFTLNIWLITSKMLGYIGHEIFAIHIPMIMRLWETSLKGLDKILVFATIKGQHMHSFRLVGLSPTFLLHIYAKCANIK